MIIMRKIKIDHKIHEFDISDGKGEISFGCNGVGGMRANIDDKQVSDNCFVENHNMLDGKVNFKAVNETRNFSFYKLFHIDDERYEKLKEIHPQDWKKYKKIPLKDRIKTILFGLKYFDIDYICEGYYFGKELTYEDFCVAFNKNEISVFSSKHNGFIAPNYIELKKNDNDFSIVYQAIKKSIKKYFDI